jgi:hypothetical protein
MDRVLTLRTSEGHGGPRRIAAAGELALAVSGSIGL